jgi:hypothetical protein
MPGPSELRAAVVGTGFIGVVHAEAVGRLGIEVLGVVGSSATRALAKAVTAPLPAPYESFEAMPDEPDFPPFHDGDRENVLGEAVATSARERRWVAVEVPA